VVNLSRDALFSVEGRTVVLTGASGFLGRSMVQTLLTNGARVVALGRSARLETLAAAWQDEFGAGRITAHRVDMYDLDAFSALLAQIAADEPRIDVLVNNAHELTPDSGFNTPLGTLERAPLDHWVRNVTAGVYWPALAVQTLGARMRAAKQGSIINIATMYAQVAPSPQLYEDTTALNPPAYSASKAALVAFTRYVASFWGSDGIRANAILPGPFSNTEEIGPNTVQDPEFLSRLQQRTCLRRVGRADELAGALLFLSSDASSFVTGHALVVDGGWTTT
jgi:NAD(P)-dependent dehydrogenase (short-subunit alcohol dehydrogenase family)